MSSDAIDSLLFLFSSQLGFGQKFIRQDTSKAFVEKSDGKVSIVLKPHPKVPYLGRFLAFLAITMDGKP